jgi:molecular chaperone GrpE
MSNPGNELQAIEAVGSPGGSENIDSDAGIGEVPVAGESAGEAAVAPERSAALAELKAQAAKAAEHWDRLLRVTADFDNYRKRAQREKQDAARFANEALLQKLLPALDSLDMALAAAETQGASGFEALKTGIGLVHGQLKSALIEAGLEEIDATAKPFDPLVHEAVSQQESDQVPEGHVVQQLRKGYRLNERLLRPAMVVVAKAPGR